jgi:hypothetical protein
VSWRACVARLAALLLSLTDSFHRLVDDLQAEIVGTSQSTTRWPRIGGILLRHMADINRVYRPYITRYHEAVVGVVGVE